MQDGDGRNQHLDPTTKRPPARIPNLAVSAVVLTGSERGKSVPVRERLRIGKAQENQVILTDPTVSRNHCEIVRTPYGFRIHDLDSTNGTFLEGNRIADAFAGAGSVLRVGGIDIALRPDAEMLDVVPSEATSFEGVIGQSAVMRRIFRVLEAVARTDATVLLQGETGTGKEVLARALVQRSHRPEPYIVIDCSAVTPTLISSELFGHERGAFTGAVAQRKGAFEIARGGTVFLDELCKLPLDLQPMLLRVLEAREFRRVGGSQTLRADVRVVAASSRDLEREVSAGRFREDLFFRLAVVPIHVPPLRARREDIPPLVDHLLAQLKGMARPSERTMDWLLRHDWPGNVRELRNILERAVYLSSATECPELVLPALPTHGAIGRGDADAAGQVFQFSSSESYREAHARYDEEFERRYVAALLNEHGGNISRAARAAQMDRKYLGILARKHGLRSSSDEPD